jgi:hypothetical protein
MRWQIQSSQPAAESFSKLQAGDPNMATPHAPWSIITVFAGQLRTSQLWWLRVGFELSFPILLGGYPARWVDPWCLRQQCRTV